MSRCSRRRIGSALRRDDGSLTLEFVLIVPMVLLLLGLVVLYGRVSEFNGRLEAATRDAARAATLARSQQEAKEVASDLVRASVAPGACMAGGPRVVLRDDQFIPGELVTIVTTCTYSVEDLGLPGLPKTFTKTVQFSSLLDEQRGLG